jgi:hypothetical protein
MRRTPAEKLIMGAGLIAAAIVLGSAVAAAIRQGSWGPIETVAWLPAVLVASFGWKGGRCGRRRGQPHPDHLR